MYLPMKFEVVPYILKDVVDGRYGKDIDRILKEYVGTLNFDDSGKVVSATPHYIEVLGQVFGDDGYCTDIFDKIRELSGDN